MKIVIEDGCSYRDAMGIDMYARDVTRNLSWHLWIAMVYGEHARWDVDHEVSEVLDDDGLF